MRLGITKAESKNNCFAYLNLMYLNVYCTFWVISSSLNALIVIRFVRRHRPNKCNIMSFNVQTQK